MKRTGIVDDRYPISYTDLWNAVKYTQGIAKECSPDELKEFDDDTPHVQLTIGYDVNGWAGQTGDNSYFGGAYGFRHWAVTYVPRTGPLGDCVRDLAKQIQETWENE